MKHKTYDSLKELALTERQRAIAESAERDAIVDGLERYGKPAPHPFLLTALLAVISGIGVGLVVKMLGVL